MLKSICRLLVGQKIVVDKLYSLTSLSLVTLHIRANVNEFVIVRTVYAKVNIGLCMSAVTAVSCLVQPFFTVTHSHIPTIKITHPPVYLLLV